MTTQKNHKDEDVYDGVASHYMSSKGIALRRVLPIKEIPTLHACTICKGSGNVHIFTDKESSFVPIHVQPIQQPIMRKVEWTLCYARVCPCCNGDKVTTPLHLKNFESKLSHMNSQIMTGHVVFVEDIMGFKDPRYAEGAATYLLSKKPKAKDKSILVKGEKEWVTVSNSFVRSGLIPFLKRQVCKIHGHKLTYWADISENERSRYCRRCYLLTTQKL